MFWLVGTKNWILLLNWILIESCCHSILSYYFFWRTIFLNARQISLHQRVFILWWLYICKFWILRNSDWCRRDKHIFGIWHHFRRVLSRLWYMGLSISSWNWRMHTLLHKLLLLRRYHLLVLFFGHLGVVELLAWHIHSILFYQLTLLFHSHSPVNLMLTTPVCAHSLCCRIKRQMGHMSVSGGPQLTLQVIYHDLVRISFEATLTHTIFSSLV